MLALINPSSDSSVLTTCVGMNRLMKPSKLSESLLLSELVLSGNSENIPQPNPFVPEVIPSDLPIRPLMDEGNFNGKAETLRARFREWASGRGGVEAPGAMLETTLVRNGTYVGRRFSLLGFSLIWFVQEGQLKLLGPQGNQLDTQAILDFPSVPTQNHH
jgi:hypothetical protein